MNMIEAIQLADESAKKHGFNMYVIRNKVKFKLNVPSTWFNWGTYSVVSGKQLEQGAFVGRLHYSTNLFS